MLIVMMLPACSSAPATSSDQVMARIDSYSPSIPVKVKTGDIVTISVTFTNTGKIPWQFIGGASVWDDKGSIAGDYERTMDLPLKPGESVTMQWEHKVVTGSQWIQFGAWKQKPYIKENLLGKSPSPSQILVIGED